MLAGRNALVVVTMLWSAAINAHAATLQPLPKLDLSNTFPGVNAQIREANAAAQARPCDPNAVGKLGMVLDAYQQYAAAEICYHRANLLSPLNFSWAYDRAYVEMKLGRYRDASAEFQAALKLRPDYLPATLNLMPPFDRAVAREPGTVRGNHTQIFREPRSILRTRAGRDAAG